MEAYLAKDPQLKDSGQRAFVSYIKAVFLMKDKNIFKVNELDTDSYAKSLGLTIPPRIRFLQRAKTRMLKAHNTKAEESNNERVSEDSGMSEDEEQMSLQEKDKGTFQVPDDDSEGDDMIKVKRKNHDMDLPTANEIFQLENRGKNKKKPLTKAAVAKMILKKKIQPNKKIIFDDEGETTGLANDKKSEIALEYENEEAGGIDIEKAKLVLKEEDKIDRQLFKQRVKAKHKEEKRKLKEKKKKVDDDEPKDEFGTDSENEPDLSWLPDPDKIYNKSVNANEDTEGVREEERITTDIKLANSDEESETDSCSKGLVFVFVSLKNIF